MKSLNEQAYEHIRNKITHQELSYQEVYSETKLAKELGISRTPFRDAIHRLVQEGYIDIIPSRGFRLHQLTAKDVEDTFQLRSALEGYCTREIAKQAFTPKAKELFRELQGTVNHLKEILDTSRSIPEFVKYDFQFHCKIIGYVNNEQFSSLFDTYMYRMQSLAALSLAHEGRMQETYEEHATILQKMREGNIHEIYETTLQHMIRPRGINLEDVLRQAQPK